MMKKSLIAVAILGAFAGTAQAEGQSDLINLYGVIDAAVRHTTNVTPNGGSYTGFSQGLFNGSRFGMKGSEALDGGMKAIYKVEAGFTLGTGAADQQGQLFGREAWAGLQDQALGTVTVGRQYGNFSDAIGTGDVFGEKHGNLVYSSTMAANGINYPNQGDTVAENGFIYQEMGYRWDNSVQYANKIDSVKFAVMHSFSGQTSAAALNSGNKASMNSASLGYVSDVFNLTAGYQTEGDGLGKNHKGLGFGANYMYGEKNGVYLSYLNSKYDAGFTRIGLGTNSSLAVTATTTARKDNIYMLSANYYATEKLNLIGELTHDSASNVLAAADSGVRNGVLATADYYLSKNTDTYLMVAHTKFTGALIGNGNGGNTGVGFTAGNVAQPSSANTVMVGMRHRF